MKAVFIITLCCILLLAITEATHFRGGTVSWKYIRNVGNDAEIEFNYRFGWRLDSVPPICDDSAIANGDSGYGGQGSWYFSPSSPSTNLYAPGLTTEIICTTYEANENWAYGYNSFLANMTAPNGPSILSFKGGDWISTLYVGGDGKWTVPTTIDLGVRSDTGTVNNPPTTFSSPIVRFKQGCQETLQIRFVDADNDRVTCRYATNTIEDECADVCYSGYPHFTLDENACTIEYNGLGGTYLIPVALMLEDHPRQSMTLDGNRQFTTSDPLSKVPLQFIVSVEQASSCNTVPTYPPNSIAEDENVTVPDSGSLDVILLAYASSQSATVNQFVVLGPLGVQNSPIYSAGNGLFASNMTWTPASDQGGKHIICFYATDTDGQSGKQRCFNVEVSEISSPCDADNGGCNDVCVPLGAQRQCACSLPCWEILSDMKTCSPSMDITCDGESIQISLPACASNNTIAVGTNTDDTTQRECQSVIKDSKHTLDFSRLQCGVTTWSNPHKFMYMADVWIWHDEGSESIISRGEWRKIPITCSLASSTNLNGSFVPQLPINDEFLPEEITIDGMGTFSFFFINYKAENYSETFGPEDLPLEVSVSDRMYFSLGAVGIGPLELFVEECTASTSDSSGQSTLRYTFIDDGCLIDSTLTLHPSPTVMEVRFSIQAFEFQEKLLSSRDDAEIRIQCQVLLCDSSSNGTRCDQGCISPAGRRKRSVRLNGIIPRVVQSRSGAEEDDDDDDDDSVPQITISQSPPQSASLRFNLVSDGDGSPGDGSPGDGSPGDGSPGDGSPGDGSPDDSGNSGNANYGNWVLITVAQYLLVRCLG